MLSQTLTLSVLFTRTHPRIRIAVFGGRRLHTQHFHFWEHGLPRTAGKHGCFPVCWLYCIPSNTSWGRCLHMIISATLAPSSSECVLRNVHAGSSFLLCTVSRRDDPVAEDSGLEQHFRKWTTKRTMLVYQIINDAKSAERSRGRSLW